MKNRIKTLEFIIFICLLSLIVIPSSYAVFKKVQTGTSQASLATWTVTLSEPEENNYLSILPNPSGTEASYDINITSQAEVDIIYTIVVENLPPGVSVSLDNNTFIPEENNKVIFSDVYVIPYNANIKTKTHTLTFKAAPNTSQVNEQEVDIDVIARQKL